MWRWLLLVLIVGALIAGGLTFQLWGPPLWTFLGANKDQLGALKAVFGLVGAITTALVAIWAFLRGRKPDADAPPPPEAGPPLTLETEPPLTDEGRVTRRYLGYLGDRYRYLDLKGMGVSDRVPLRLPLLDLYVPVQARAELPAGETWDRRATVAGRALSEEEAARLGKRLSEPRPVLKMVREHGGLVLLGDPGSGKTTFLKFLAVTLATGGGAELGLDDRLPVLVPLSAYANALAGGEVRLDDFVSSHVRELGGDAGMDAVLASALAEGRALLLLDGLDEVRETALRETVVRRVVDFFAFHRRAGNKFVVTSRVVGYREVRTVAEGLGEATLVDFDDEEIAAFVERWTAALERQAQGETAAAELDAEEERRELLAAVERNPGVRRLAANPLLLTILALMKRQGVALPERRVELYDRYVRTLLSSWNRARGLGRPPQRDLDVVETVRILAPLALWMHEVDPGLGLVKRGDLERKLHEIFRDLGEADPETATRRFLADVREHAGLLLERGHGEYGFIHLTFEEYLAAAAIALGAQGDAGAVVARLTVHLGEPAWREVSLLLIGYLGLIQQLNAVGGEVLERLVTDRPGPLGEAVVLAGEALLDVGAAGVTPRSREAVIEALVETMQGSEVSKTVRRQAGLLLGRLGWVPEDLDVFVEVPPRPFLYGKDKEERVIGERFWIARYPVTNLQYARFVADEGYEREELWSEDGWRWRTKSNRRSPLDYFEDDVNPVFPRIGVTFYEAEAYCRWLVSVAEGFEVEGEGESVPTGQFRARLPTEEEWERAARGVDGRIYPWGDRFETSQANTVVENRAIRTTAVCTYPQGRSPVGALDMSGNVWEWTTVWFQKNRFYWCGGSWDNSKDYAPCHTRLAAEPDDYRDLVGFRVVLSLADSDS